MQLRDFFRMAGETWEIRRNGQVVITVEGIRRKEKEKVDFEPGTDVRVGDELFGTLCQQIYRVTKTDVVTAHGKLFSIEAYYNHSVSKRGGHTFNIGSSVGSPIMVDSPGGSQNVNLTEKAAADLREILRKLIEEIDELGLEEYQKQEMRDDAEYLNKKLNAVKPDPGMIQECIGGIKKRLTDAASAAAAIKIVTKAGHYLELLTNYMGRHLGF